MTARRGEYSSREKEIEEQKCSPMLGRGTEKGNLQQMGHKGAKAKREKRRESSRNIIRPRETEIRMR